MKRRKNAVYTGQRTRGSEGRGSRKSRKVVDAFYAALNEKLFPEDEIEIIPPEQVNPTHALQEQCFIVADYCVRKILPEVTGLFRWGDEVTPRLRALAPAVDNVIAQAATTRAGKNAAFDAYAASLTVDATATTTAAAATAYAAYTTAMTTADVNSSAFYAATCVYRALVTCIEAEDEAAYNRITALTNEMLESL